MNVNFVFWENKKNIVNLSSTELAQSLEGLIMKSSFTELKGEDFGRMSLMDLLLQDEMEEVQVRRIPNIHRANYVTGDRKGRNFASLQSLPNCR